MKVLSANYMLHPIKTWKHLVKGYCQGPLQHQMLISQLRQQIEPDCETRCETAPLSSENERSQQMRESGTNRTRPVPSTDKQKHWWYDRMVYNGMALSYTHTLTLSVKQNIQHYVIVGDFNFWLRLSLIFRWDQRFRWAKVNPESKVVFSVWSQTELSAQRKAETSAERKVRS